MPASQQVPIMIDTDVPGKWLIGTARLVTGQQRGVVAARQLRADSLDAANQCLPMEPVRAMPLPFVALAGNQGKPGKTCIAARLAYQS